jgi:hypothetical protein
MSVHGREIRSENGMTYDDEKGTTSVLGCTGQSSGKVPAHIVHDRTNDQIRKLRHNQPCHERRPMIHFALLFSRLIHVTTLNEKRPGLAWPAKSRADRRQAVSYRLLVKGFDIPGCCPPCQLVWCVAFLLCGLRRKGQRWNSLQQDSVHESIIEGAIRMSNNMP